MLSTGDKLVLDTLMQLCEVCAEACNSYHQILVILRMQLCVLQSLCINTVELNVVAALIYKTVDQRYQCRRTILGFKGIWVDLDVKMC